MSSIFFDKLLERVDKVDPARLRMHMQRLRREWKMQETIFQSIHEGVVVLDAQGRFVDANHAACDMLGFDITKVKGKSSDRYLGELDWISPHEGDTSEEDDWSHALSREIEVAYPKRRILSVYAVLLQETSEEGEPALLIIVRDVTGERDQEASTMEDERLDAVKNLAAGVAHEIGNPLNALNIHLQILGRELKAIEDESMRDDFTGLVDVAKNEVVRLDAIIRQFLNAIRPAKPNLCPGDIVKVLGETLDVMRVDIENRRIEVAVAAPGSIPQVLFDENQIKQVFFNLLKNGMEAMPDGGKLAVNISAGDAFVRIDFRDNGIGIKPEELDRIFEPYHTTKSKGTGLGLMIVQRIIKDHGGQIEVSSKEGEGTRFGVMLPLAEKRIRKIASNGETK